MADHDRNHRSLAEKNVPKVFILPSRWQDGAESLGIETTSCLGMLLCQKLLMTSTLGFSGDVSNYLGTTYLVLPTQVLVCQPLTQCINV